MMVIKLVVWYNISDCESLFALIKRSIQICRLSLDDGNEGDSSSIKIQYLRI